MTPNRLSLNRYAGEVTAAAGVSGEGSVAAFIDSREGAAAFGELRVLLKAKGVDIAALSQDESLLADAGIQGTVISHDAAHGAELAGEIFRRFADTYRDWYLPGGEDPTVVSGLSLGFIYELDAYGLFRNAIWRLENIRAAIDRMRPDVMVTFFPEGACGAEICAFLAGGSGTRVVNVPPDAASKRLELWLRLGYLGWLYRFVKAKSGNKTRRAVDGAKYLFVYIGDSQSGIDSIAAVSSEFAGHEVLHLAEGKPTRDALEKRGIAALNYEDITGWGAVIGVLYGRGRLINNWKKAGPRLSGSDKFDYKGVSLYPLLTDELDQLMIKGVHNTLGRAYALKRLLEKGIIRGLLVSTDFHPAPREAALLCRRYGTPSLEVVHGMVGVPIFYVPLTADKAAVWGEEMRDWFVSHGTDPGRLVITGHPRYDGLKVYENMKEKIKAGLGIGADKRVVLYTTCRLPGEIKTVEMCLDALADRDDIAFVIKTHPGEKTDEYERLIKGRARPCSMVVSGKNIFDMLAMCDIVLLIFSGVGLEAVLMGKPLVIVSEGTAWDRDRFVADGVALRATNPAELRVVADRFLSGLEEHGGLKEDRVRYIFRHNYLNDGKAGKRVAECLAGMSAGKVGKGGGGA